MHFLYLSWVNKRLDGSVPSKPRLSGGLPQRATTLVPAWLRSTSPHHSHNTLRSQQQTHPPRSTQTNLLLQLAAFALFSTARNSTAPDSAHPITQPCSTPPSSLRLSPHAPSPLLGSLRLPLAPRYQSVEDQLPWNGKMTARRPRSRN